MSYDGNERITRRPEEAVFDRDLPQNMAHQYRLGIQCASTVSGTTTANPLINNNPINIINPHHSLNPNNSRIPSTNHINNNNNLGGYYSANANGFLHQQMASMTENSGAVVNAQAATPSVLRKPSAHTQPHLQAYHHQEDEMDIKITTTPTDYYFSNNNQMLMKGYNNGIAMNNKNVGIMENETKMEYTDVNYWQTTPHLMDMFQQNSNRNEMSMSMSSNQDSWLDPYYMAASPMLLSSPPPIMAQESSSIPLTLNRNYGNFCCNDFGFPFGIIPELVEIRPSLKADYEMEDENIYPMLKVQDSQNKESLAAYQALNHHSMKSIDGMMSDDPGMMMNTDEADLENDLFDCNMNHSMRRSEDDLVSMSYLSDCSYTRINSDVDDDDCDLFTDITSYEPSNQNNASVEDLISAKMSVWSDDMKHIFLAGCKIIDSKVYRKLRENVLNMGKSEPSPSAKLFIERLGQVRNLKSYMKMNNIL